MAEVFISYSRSDRAHAQRIAANLQAAGLGVWWDRELLPGDQYDTEIERQIDSAKCVVVIWSASSVASKWVRSEAAEADDRRILIPVAIEAVRLPLAFRLNQTENLTDWTGAQDCEAWQRVLLQAQALVGKPSSPADTAAGATSPRPSKVPLIGGEVARRSAPASLLTIAAPVFFLATWGWGAVSGKGALAIALALAALAFVLFRLAEHDLSPHMKALATRWLLPKEGEFRVNTAEAFNHMFEAVFGRNHFSAECFVKSTLISTAFLTSIILLEVSIFGSTVHHTASSTIGLILFGFTVNALGDYVALYKTRLLLRRYKAGTNIVWVTLIDILAIFVIFFSAVALAVMFIYGLSYLSGGRTFSGVQGYFYEVGKTIWLIAQQPLIDLFGYNPTARFPHGDRVLLYSTFITMFMTSLWFWTALILSPIIRFAFWSRITGLTFLGFMFDVHHAPLTAVGYLSSFLILFVGATFSGVEEVLAAIRPG